MAELNREQLERIARRLDGSDESLAVGEQALADEIRSLEQALAGKLDAEPPADVMSRVRRRLRARAQPPSHAPRIVRFMPALAAAAAVMLAVGAGLWVWSTTGPGTRTATPVAKSDHGHAAGSHVGAGHLAGVAEALAGPGTNADLDMLAREIDEFGADAVAAVTLVDVELDALERDFEELLIDYPAAEGPGI